MAILKARWPEAAFIIGIYILPILSSELLLKIRPISMKITGIIISLVSLLFCVIRGLFRCGFLRTFYTNGQKRQSLPVLLRTGIHFLWRFFVLYLIYALPFMFTLMIFSNLIQRLISPDNTDYPHTHFWYYSLFPVLVNSILIKLIILLPALIIVLDCRVFDSFRFLRRYKLSKSKEIISLYFINIAIVFLVSVISQYYLNFSYGTSYFASTAILRLIFRIISAAVTYFISLMIAVMAVRFVACYTVKYDSSPRPVDFEDLREYMDRSGQ